MPGAGEVGTDCPERAKETRAFPMAIQSSQAGKHTAERIVPTYRAADQSYGTWLAAVRYLRDI